MCYTGKCEHEGYMGDCTLSKPDCPDENCPEIITSKNLLSLPYATPNECGVYEHDQCETTHGNGKGWNIYIYVARSGKNEYHSSYGVTIDSEGASGLPWVNSEIFIDYNQAYFDAVEKALNHVTRWRNNHDCRQAIKWLKSQKQIPLF